LKVRTRLLAMLILLTIVTPNTALCETSSVYVTNDEPIPVEVETSKDKPIDVQIVTTPKPSTAPDSPAVTKAVSVNSILQHGRWKPEATDLKDLATEVQIAATAKPFAYVYTDEFTKGASNVFKGDSPMRALEVLGYDALIFEESFNFDSNAVTVPAVSKDGETSESLYGVGTYKGSYVMKDDPIYQDYALMNLYKAIGQTVYSYTIDFRQDDTTADNSVFSAILTVPLETIDFSRGLAYTFVSRSNRHAYWQKAFNDHIVYQENFNQIDGITIGDFCTWVYRVMNLYGEPTLTEMEELYLLDCYGRDIPFHLESQLQIDAIKNLLAKGIVSTDYDYEALLTRDVMLEILMKVADVNSRDTFKDVTLTTDVELLKKGYYPMEVQYSSKANYSLERVEYDYSAATYYDYFIEIVDGETDFRDANGDMCTDLYIPRAIGANNGHQYFDSTSNVQAWHYLGIINGYYHFKILASLTTKDDAAATYAGKPCLSIASVTADKTIRVELGGGYYKVSNKNNGILTRSALVESDNPNYVDIDRKANAQREAKGETQLSYGASFAEYYVKSDIPLTSDVLGCDVEVVEPGIYKLSEVGDTNDFYRKLQSLNTNSTTKTYCVYGHTGSTYLVSMDYLKDKGVVSDISDLGNGLYQLDTVYNSERLKQSRTVYIDTERNIISIGCSIYEVPKDITLYYEDSDGGKFIDYRAVLGWDSTIYSIKKSDGTTELQVNTPTVSTPLSAANESSMPVRLPFSDTTFVPITTVKNGDDLYIPLNTDYALHNFIVYHSLGTGDTAEQDYLFIIKQAKGKSSDVSEVELQAESLFTQRTGIVPDDNYLVACVMLDKNNLEATPDFTYEDGRYLYKVPVYSDIDTFLDDYLGEGNTYRALSFVNVSGTVNDYNLNMCYSDTNEYLPYGLLCGELLGKDTKVVKYTGEEVSDYNEDYSHILSAPTGIIPMIMKRPTYALSIIGQCSMFVGTQYAQLSNNGDKYSLSIGKRKLDIEVTSDSPCLVLKPGTNPTVSLADELRLTVSDEEPPLEKSNLIKGINFPKVDWEAFTLTRLLEDIDDISSIILITCLNIIPRVAWFLIMILLGLSVLVNIKPWQRFCDKIFDPYTLLTFGRQNVHTIDVKKLVIMSIFGLAAFGLLMDGTIINLISWVMYTVSGILQT